MKGEVIKSLSADVARRTPLFSSAPAVSEKAVKFSPAALGDAKGLSGRLCSGLLPRTAFSKHLNSKFPREQNTTLKLYMQNIL